MRYIHWKKFNKYSLKGIKYMTSLLSIIVMIALGLSVIYSTRNSKQVTKESKMLSNQLNKCQLMLGGINERPTIEEIELFLKKTNIRFRDVVMAQIIHETNNLRSSLYIKNNNMFGMKASNRVRAASEIDKNGYCVYHNWRESVYDYAFLQMQFKGNSKHEYINWLGRIGYAEDPEYLTKISKHVK